MAGGPKPIDRKSAGLWATARSTATILLGMPAREWGGDGGISLSEIDGWWAEAYRPEVGWALGDGQEHGDDPAWDAAEAEALYERLELGGVPALFPGHQ